MVSREDLRRWSGWDILLILALGLVGGIVLGCSLMFAVQLRDPDLNFRLISQAAGLIQRYYVDRDAIQSRNMTYGAISGMVNSLGDTGHSRFLSPQMVAEMDELERSKFQGIGAEVQLRAGHVVIVVPMDGSPAQRAGLKAGDIILKVDGQDISGWPLDKVVGQISGPAGTTVTLTILTPVSDKTRQVTLTRATINIHNVSWQTLPGTNIVQLRIAALDSGVNADLRKALAEIMAEKPAAIVLDLRNNPGGLLDQAVDVASQFLQGGNVLLVKNARGEEKPVATKGGGEATKIPLVTLVNGGTASGAEIVAGALQDAHRARLVGDTTFGTGTVLKEFKLADGSAVLLAIEEWLTPSGNVIWHKGITPNIAVSLPAGILPLFPDAERSMSAAQIQESHDAQLLRAMDVLTRGDVSPAAVATHASRSPNPRASNRLGHKSAFRFCCSFAKAIRDVRESPCTEAVNISKVIVACFPFGRDRPIPGAQLTSAPGQTTLVARSRVKGWNRTRRKMTVSGLGKRHAGYRQERDAVWPGDSVDLDLIGGT